MDDGPDLLMRILFFFLYRPSCSRLLFAPTFTLPFYRMNSIPFYSHRLTCARRTNGRTRTPSQSFARPLSLILDPIVRYHPHSHSYPHHPLRFHNITFASLHPSVFLYSASFLSPFTSKTDILQPFLYPYIPLISQSGYHPVLAFQFSILI